MSFKEVFETVDEVINKLEELDVHCSLNDIHAKLVILGGSGILLNLGLQGDTFRPTTDIDVETIASSDFEKLSGSLSKYGIQTVGGVMDVPPMEDLTNEENLFKLEGTGFTNIEVFVPSLELLACCKIFSKREKDLNDLKSTNLLNQCDKTKLNDLIEEYKPYVLNINDPFLNIHELDNIFEEKGI